LAGREARARPHRVRRVAGARRTDTPDAAGATLLRPGRVGRVITDYRRELDASGLIPHLEEQAALFWRTVSGTTSRGQRYNTGRATGRSGYEEGVRLYRTVRELDGDVLVETGVCNGVATAFILL